MWLRGGGRLVAASERAARALTGDFHRARRAEGLTAWPTPRVEPWNEFVRAAWEDLGRDDDRLVMNSIQEKALWTRIIASSRHGEKLLEAPLQRIAKMAADAHVLLCSYAPGMLKEKARSSWQDDAAAFSGWLSEFDRMCASGRLISAARLPVELLSLFEPEQTERVPLLLVGFDRVQPVQEMVLDAWGKWRQTELGETAERRNFYLPGDEQSELAACAAWCDQKLSGNPDARLMIVTQDLPARRGEMERAFLRLAGDSFRQNVEFSLGVPLGYVPLVRAAQLMLRWLTGPIEEHELDWLLGCGLSVKNEAETFALTSFIRAVRRRGMERTHWRCDEFLRQRPGASLPAEWAERMQEAIRRLYGVAEIPQLPMAWADFVSELLQVTGWPGVRALTSEEFQVLRRWQHALDMTSSLGFDGRRLTWTEYLKTLVSTLDETLFAPESQDAAIVITGPSESAGLEADAIWFMGASEDAWPATGSRHPLLPIGVQRDYRMPHATPQLDLDLARKMTKRLAASAPEVCFSCARQIGGVEMRASRLAETSAGEPRPIPNELAGSTSAQPAVEIYEDYSRVPLAADRAGGGSAVLSSQSQCPFKAFASARLGAEGWDPAEAGLNALQRGNLLHGVLHSVWQPEEFAATMN